jgi:putative addiction module killer protein
VTRPPAAVAAKVTVGLARLALGNTSHLKGLGDIAEYRIDWGPGLRIYLGREGDRIVVLLGGGTKRRQDADFERARVLWAEYRARKKASAGRNPWR